MQDVAVAVATSAAVTAARIALLATWPDFQEATDRSLTQVCACCAFVQAMHPLHRR